MRTLRTHRWLCLLVLGLAARAPAAFELLLHPQTITLDETATLRIKADGHALNGVPTLTLPEGLRVIGTSQQNIQINQTRQMVYEYRVQADKPGTYPIGPYSIQSRGQGHTIGPVTLEVTAPRISERSDSAFVTLELSAPRVYVQQAVELTLTFFSEHAVEDITLSDFNTEALQLGDWRHVPTRDQIVNGKRYQVRRYQSTAIPLTSGTFELAPTFRLDVLVPFEQLDRNVFGMMVRRQERRTMRIKAPATSLLVQAPPLEGRPAGYAGAVGRFTMQATASPSELKAGDPITVKVQLSGRGSLRNVLPPSYGESRDFKVYDARLTEEEVNSAGTAGRKTLEQVVIPRHGGVEILPALEFSFYDPDQGRYETLRQGPFPLRVLPSPNMVGELVGFQGQEALAPQAVQVLGDDLVFLKSSPGRLSPIAGYPTTRFLAWSALPLGLWAFTAGCVARRKRRDADPLGLRNRQAPARLRKGLKELEKHQEDVRAFHDALWHGLNQFLGDRLGLPPGEIDPDRLPPHVEEGTRRELAQWFDRCARVRFGGGDSGFDGPALHREFSEFTKRLNRDLSS